MGNLNTGSLAVLGISPAGSRSAHARKAAQIKMGQLPRSGDKFLDTSPFDPIRIGGDIYIVNLYPLMSSA